MPEAPGPKNWFIARFTVYGSKASTHIEKGPMTEDEARKLIDTLPRYQNVTYILMLQVAP